MRILALVLFACIATPVLGQQNGNFPADGNGLLDFCGVLVESADSPASLTSLSGDRFVEQMGKINWCAGYLQAARDVASLTHINLALIGMTGVTLAGPDKARDNAFNSLQPPCIPDKASILQIARVVVKDFTSTENGGDRQPENPHPCKDRKSGAPKCHHQPRKELLLCSYICEVTMHKYGHENHKEQ